MQKISYATSLFFVLCGSVLAQTTSLNGVVSDPSGAVVPGAQITITNAATGAQRQTVSDSSGRYAVAEVQPGTYTLRARAKGFADQMIGNIELLVNSPATVNVTFEKVGSLSEVVSVSAEAVQVNTQDATLGNAINNRPITQLPFEARNVVGLLSLQPGVTFTGVEDDYRSGAVNGGKSDQSNVLLDGVDVNDQQTRAAFTSVLRVTLDSVEEFRTTTTNGGADQGRTSGAQVSLVTKSGTNEFHGAAYEYTRNTITSANSFFNNAAGVPREKLIRNVFGAALGGPVKKNRLFFFMNFEGRRDAQDASAVRTVPTDTFRQGIFAYQRTDGTVGYLSPQQIAEQVDPLHIGPSPAILQFLQSYPHPNDNTVGDGINTSGYRFKSSTPLRYNTYITRLDYQLDSAGKHHLFIRGNLQNDHLTPAGGIPEFPGQADSSLRVENSKGLAAGYTWVISPAAVSTWHYGLTRQSYDITGVQAQSYVDLRDISPLNAETLTGKQTIPLHQISNDTSWSRGAHTIDFGGVARFIRVRRSDTGTFSDGYVNSSWFNDTGQSLFDAIPDADPGYYTDFTRKMTDLLGIISEGDAYYYYDKSGNLLAPGAPIKRTYVDNEYELYLKDTWKVKKNLSVSLGLRASLFPALYEANGIQTSSNIPLSDWFNIRGGLAQQGEPQSMAPALSFNLKDAPGGRPLYPFQKHFAPRAAIAYSPDFNDGWIKKLTGGPGKTSIRMGWGMYYDLFGQSLIQLANATALGFSTQLSNPANADESTAPRFTSVTGLPAGLLPAAPPGGFPQVAPDAFAITTGLDDKIEAPYTMNTDFSIGREFSHGFFVQTSYVGRFSRKSLQGDDVAIPTDLKDTISGMDYFTAATAMQKYVRANADVNTVAPIPWFEDIFPGYAGGGYTATQNIFQNYWLPSGPGNDSLGLAYIDDGPSYGCDPCSKFGPNALYNPQYSSLAVFRSRGSGDYNAFQLTVRKSFSSGIQFDFNYTLSKSIDLGSTRETDGRVISQIVNPWSPGQMRAISDYDSTHVVSAFMVAELPFGRGKKFGSGMSRALDALVGGWQLSGIWRMSSGLPAWVDNGGQWPTNWNVEGAGTKISEPVVGTTKNSTSGGPNIFPNPDVAFQSFDLTYPGESGTRNPIRGDGFFTIDVGLAKRFVMPYNEKHSIQFRAEAFNVTNTVRFDPSFYSVSLSLGTEGSFGKYNGTLNTPRVLQFGARYEF
ncbi:MAG TPA: carboxypeptidase-like regulatory domain-containing protein [Bryobacteraceae bacterium]|nr:carboxypeptidase-like regulatory domain-containing protein [Bryobacteraceae bacterium]